MKVSSPRMPLARLGGALFGALLLGGIAPRIPAPSAIAAPTIDAEDKKVIDQLTAVLQRR
jgi:hypothetical protein